MKTVVSFRLYKQRRTPYDDLVGSIRLGDFEESFHTSTRYWSPDDYEQQWNATMAGLIQGDSVGCFVSSLDDPLLPESTAFLWSCYKLGEELLFRNSMRFLGVLDSPLPKGSFESWVRPRTATSEDGERISEWSVPLAGLTTEVQIID